MDRDDLELFERSLGHATEAHTGAELDDALAELGWAEALETEPRASIESLFELQGRSGATSGALGRLVVTGLGTTSEAVAVLPAMGRWDPPGECRSDGLAVRGVTTHAALSADHLVVPAADGDEVVVATVDRAALDLRVVEGLDPWAGLVEVHGRGVAPTGPPAAVTARWATTVATAHLALAHQLIGTSATMLELASTHASERVQFGQPIAAFQAVRHRLAETLVAIETVRAVADAAWIDSSPTTALMAKATAGREARIATRHCQQVLAGIGFTTEHDLHRFIRRALVLDATFGTAKALTAAFGADLLADRRLPPLLPL